MEQNITYNVLIIGSGGREHTFAWKICKSPLLGKLFVAPGNAGTAKEAHNVDLDISDFPAIGKLITRVDIHLIIVGPEVPLVAGLADYLSKHYPDVLVVGPHADGAQLEGSKAYAKMFMAEFDIPTAGYREFSSAQRSDGLTYLQSHPLPIVLKADGLAAGKGVVICQTHGEAAQVFEEMLDGKFGDAGARVVVEEFLDGTEFSVFVALDGDTHCILPIAKDYKRIGEGDKGPNTGGMGSISPVPFVDAALREKVLKRIIEPSLKGIKSRDLTYRGFLFIGLIEVAGNPYVIEYNCRMGDPETQSVLRRIDSDVLALCIAIAKGELSTYDLEISPKRVASVILVSGGYPGSYEKGYVIHGIDQVKDAMLFHAGTKIDQGEVVTNGGRVLAVSALGHSIDDALATAYREASQISFEGKNFRRDLGFDLDTEK
ncbi:MAG: phosphoribosylamine--glycine ligase [Saprospiraceae bacterium]|nr:phosphoribosylamine--glycine ligase [Saprospiraceae bacterium]